MMDKRFQFLLVRLKVKAADDVQGWCQFQFLLVRLKDKQEE